MAEALEHFHLHLVSDSTGETVSSVARSVLSLYENVEVEEHMWSLVRTKGQMERVLDNIKEQPGLVLFTVMDEALQKHLREACKEMNVACIPVLNNVIREMSNFIGKKSVKMGVGKQYELDDEYFSRVEAINFTLAHDDGQNPHELEDAEIVLVGPSRTSKTPTCVYLSYRGIYAANVPFVSGCPLPQNLFELKQPLVVGLTISPERLIQIRKSRLLSLNEQRETNYVDIDYIKNEVAEVRKIFTREKWPVIDVTRRSIEETVAKITTLYNEHKKH